MVLKKEFFDSIRDSLFNGKLSSNQVNGINSILIAWNRYGNNDLCQFAYVLATAYHETGKTIQPVREGFAKDTASAIAAVTRLFTKGVIRKNYSDLKNGKSYFGRGYVQLTWDYNYAAMGRLIGQPLLENPDLALNPDISAQILVVGMMKGTFTGKSLSQYINGSDGKQEDYENARRIINGLDKAELIATYATKFEKALKL